VARDHAAEVRALIDSETTGSYNARDIAARIVAKLEATDPDLLAGWLQTQATTVMYAAINQRDRSLRGHARTAAAAAAFEADAVSGDPQAMGRWLDLPYSVENGVRKPLGDMTAADLIAASQSYNRRAVENRMVGAFLTALSRRVGRGVVREHYTDDQLGRMWLSITSGGGSEL
jgi:hypothetical protein